MTMDEEDILLYEEYINDWNKFAREVIGARLDRKQREILRAIQKRKRVSVRSAHAAGKDYVAAVAALCFLYLNIPSKVIMTAPTNRQVIDIMMSEVSKLHRNAKVNLGGRLLTNKIVFDEDSDWFLEGFKARDKVTEDWSGYHSPNLMVVITEATGVEQETFDAIEGILTGDSRLVLIFNPNRTSGEAYKSTKDPDFKKFKISAFNCVNVRAKKILISGQVDWEWVNDKVGKPGWSNRIEESEAKPENFDFKWLSNWYRPSDLFLINVLGEFGRESEDSLIPYIWVEMANERWQKVAGVGNGSLKLGVDVAGMGVDKGVHAFRRGDVIEKFKVYSQEDHMAIVGYIKNELTKGTDDEAEVDAIGEGAGVYSRLVEQGVNAKSVKGSRAAEGLTDLTGQRTFVNMRAYLYWAIRDALDPNLGGTLALPPIDELAQDLTAIHWTPKSNGKIIMEPKDNIKIAIGRSPDYGDAVACTFLPVTSDGFRYIDFSAKAKKKTEDKDKDKDKKEQEPSREDDETVGDHRERLFNRLEEDEDD